MVRRGVSIVKAIEIKREVEVEREAGNRASMTKMRKKLIIYNLSTFTIFCPSQSAITIILT